MIAHLCPRRFAHRLHGPSREAILTTTYGQFPQLPLSATRRITTAALALALLANPATAQRVPPPDNTVYARAIAAGYKALTYCEGIFAAGRTPAQIDREELAGIYPEYDAIVPTLAADVNSASRTVRVAWSAAVGPREASWHSGTGCGLLPVGASGEIVSFERPLPATPKGDPRPWPIGDAGIAPRPSPALRVRVAEAFDGRTYGAGKTIAVLVLRDGAIAAERYAEGWGPFTPNRTWSAGKSLAGTLIGLAQADAAGALRPDRPAPVAQWQSPDDPRKAIRLDSLLRMASGLHSDTAGNRTDAIYFGGTAVDEQAATWPLEAAPGTRFRYANNDILLAILATRQVLGEQRYRALPARLFTQLGMRHTEPGTDWRGNYIMSSQVWSTARDLARLGQFWLQDGVWQGKRLLPEGWVRYMTTPSGPQPADGPGYGATMWLFGPNQGLPAGSYAAQGNRGQYVMVVPSAKLVIVRRGEDPGAARFDIAKFSADVLAATK